MNNKTIVAITAICITIFFAYDINSELGIAGGVTYVLAILLLSFQNNKRLIWYGAILTTLLTLLGLILSPSGGEIYKVLTNGILALLIIWGTSILVVKYISLQSKINKTKSMRLINGIDNEQKKIAEDIHEGTVQLIATAKSIIEFHLEKNNSNSEKDNYAEIKEASLILKSAIIELKNISIELQPSILKDFGLIAGINFLLDSKINETGLKVHLNTNFDENMRLDQFLEVNLFKITQECINISLNDTVAKNVKINLLVEDDLIIFDYWDDGNIRSLSIENTSILYIKERCLVLEGNFKIISSEEPSFNISIAVPYKIKV